MYFFVCVLLYVARFLCSNDLPNTRTVYVRVCGGMCAMRFILFDEPFVRSITIIERDYL